MPKIKTHVAFAIAIVFLAFYSKTRSSFEANFKLFGNYAFFCIMGALAPDIIEPAVSRKHRKFFHSALLLFLLSLTEAYIFKRGELAYFAFFILGYISHLLLDAMTKERLPLM